MRKTDNQNQAAQDIPSALPDAAERSRVVSRVSSVSIAVNLVLSVAKLAAGVLAHSGAMVSDAVHSASDVFSTVIVIIGYRFSVRDADKDHPYGHERMECLAGIVLSVILFVTGLGIAKTAFDSILSGRYQTSMLPGIAALVMAILSVLSKEGLYQYTMIFAKKIDSSALKADAWHHRSDALSSVGAGIGIVCARTGFPICEPIACLVICLFILKAAVDIFRDAADKMVDKACDDATEQEMRAVIAACPGVVSLAELKTRLFGAKVYVDATITANGQLPLTQAHAIAEEVHDRIEAAFPGVKHCMVHVDPAAEEKTAKDA